MAKQWKLVQQSGAIQKWEPGLVVTGVFLKMRDGQYGPLIDLTDEHGKQVTYGVPTILNTILKDVALNTELRITCKGKIALKNGTEAWSFSVEKSIEENADPAAATASDPDSDIPF